MDDDRRKRIGRKLQDIRGTRDQRTFADAVDSVQQTISKYERGEIPRSWMFLARLAEEEGVELNRLLLGESSGHRTGEAGSGGGSRRSESGGNGGSEHRRADSREFSGALGR